MPQAAQAVQHAVEGEGQEVEHHQQVGQAVGTMAEIVLQVVALARQAVESLIFDKM